MAKHRIIVILCYTITVHVRFNNIASGQRHVCHCWKELQKYLVLSNLMINLTH